jgi:hypothetical protein
MKILFYLAVWKRPEITEICFMGLRRLMKTYDSESLAVISEESMIPLCEKYGIMWMMHENLPIGKKKNAGLKHALNLEWDYVVELGSDDLIKNELIELYKPFFGKDKFLSVGSVAFINSENGACRWISARSPFGLGRCLHRSVIETVPELYRPNYNSGLDKDISFKLGQLNILERIVPTDKPLTIDIKSEVNIWKYSPVVGKKISFSEVTAGLGSDEVDAICSLKYATV